jgi:APA family basic amino acid/polyamine antiporter
MSETEPKQLRRVLGFWDIVSLVIGGVIGSGIFLVPKDIAAAVGSPLLILAVWVVGGILSLFGALSFGELGAAMPEAGGVYVYLREAYGPMIALLLPPSTCRISSRFRRESRKSSVSPSSCF